MSLARSGEPLRLSDGRVVYPGGNVGDSHAPHVEKQEAPQTVIRATRRITDLPATTKQMNAIGAVLAYTLFGLDVENIAEAVGTTIERIEQIRLSDPYRQMHDTIVRSVLDSETDVVRELIAKNARDAAQVMVDGLQAGNRADRMSAARDILDRSGHRPADVIEHRHRMDGGLVIEVVRRDAVSVPTIDMGGV
jgi:hypothetical protein